MVRTAFRAEGRRDVANARVWIWIAWRELISQAVEVSARPDESFFGKKKKLLPPPLPPPITTHTKTKAKTNKWTNTNPGLCPWSSSGPVWMGGEVRQAKQEAKIEFSFLSFKPENTIPCRPRQDRWQPLGLEMRCQDNGWRDPQASSEGVAPSRASLCVL